MRIEIAEPGRMTQTGSSLLKLIQNNNMPVLDLLVRESIQNSLDARKKDSKYVEVNYITGQFDNNRLSQELEGITESLRRCFPESVYDFIAAKDSNTVGLTGELDYKKVKDNDYGNLLKLIYEICKPQEAEGAGGSWGLGKTVYFRIGIGIVIYYSRIRTDSGYESRLAASYVENETADDAMIPVYKEQAKRGIAWWGEQVGENLTQPVTDESYIEDFLKIFGMDPYLGDETGTTIIIPYINRETLLSNNQIEYLNSNEEPVIPYWCHDIDIYLKIAVQRWYAPRLNNPKYTNGAYLRLKINDCGLAFSEMEPVFKVIQALYNRANYVDNSDILEGIDVKVEGIRIFKYLKDTNSGVVAYAKIPKGALGMEAPYNKPEPFMFFNCEVQDAEVNKPTVCFTRSPAMIVSYENVGAWASNIAATSKEEYILAVFVLNSWNMMKNSPVERSLEEYVRKCEMADHTSWSDWSEGTYNPRIITKIQNGVNRIISKEFAPTDDRPIQKEHSGLGKFFGDMLLPPDGFGKNPTPPPSPGASGKDSKRRGVVFRVSDEKIAYYPGKMIVPLILETVGKKKISKADFEIKVDSEANRMTVNEWEEKMGLQVPFVIKDCLVEVGMVDKQVVNESCKLTDNQKEAVVGDLHFEMRTTKNGSGKGFSLILDKPHTVKIHFSVIVAVNRTDIKPVFIFEKEAVNG